MTDHAKSAGMPGWAWGAIGLAAAAVSVMAAYGTFIDPPDRFYTPPQSNMLQGASSSQVNGSYQNSGGVVMWKDRIQQPGETVRKYAKPVIIPGQGCPQGVMPGDVFICPHNQNKVCQC